VEGKGYREICSDGLSVDIFDDSTESDRRIILGHIDGVDGMRKGLGNCGEEVKVAGSQGCGCVDDSADSRIDGITKLRAKLENDVEEGRLDWNWQGVAVGDICGKDLQGLLGWNGEHVDDR
jgi:hypothetical protein